MLVRFMIVSALVLALAGATGATAGPSCTWGASSTLVWIDAAGVEHQAPATVTGCTP
jgi:hypothetical protein